MATRAQIYREILREYDALRTRKAAELRERKESLYERFPRLAEIEEELSLLGISAARTALGSPEGIEMAVQELKGRQHKLAAERLEIFEAAGIYIEESPCVCLKRRVMDRLYDQSNVRDVIRLENFDTFDLRLFSGEAVPEEGASPKENAQRNLKTAMAFAEDFTGGNLLLYGGTGRGKTFLCNCIAKDVLERGKNVLYLTAGQMFKQLEEMRFGQSEDEERTEWDEELLDVDLLIIDDLGTEFSTVFTASELFRIINDRKLRKKPVVISTNLEIPALMDQYSDRVMSRLIGEYTVMKFFGEDMRMKKKYQK